MLTNQTRQSLHTLRLPGMAQAYEDQLNNPATQSLGFDDRFGMIVDAEVSQRENRRVSRLIKTARLKAPRPAAKISISRRAAGSTSGRCWN